jgi:hypothetical protein
MGLDEGLLDDVVGHGGIIEDALNAAPHAREMLAMQLAPGGFLTGAEALEEIVRGVHQQPFTW